MLDLGSTVLPPRILAIFDELAVQRQDPEYAGTVDGCYAITFAHRDRPGRGTVYCAPGGSWTHSRNRAAQLAKRFPHA